MTREEAIKWFEGEKEAAERQVVAFENCFKCFKSAHRKIVAYNDMAIAALREQEERSKGCEHCSDSERDLYYHENACHSMSDFVYVTGNSIVCDFGCKAYASFEIKFCPMCGRRLEEV